MSGWQKPVARPKERNWEDEVVALYMRSPDMHMGTFEALMEVALQGEQPEHPDLPMFLPVFGLPPRPDPDRLGKVTG